MERFPNKQTFYKLVLEYTLPFILVLINCIITLTERKKHLCGKSRICKTCFKFHSQRKQDKIIFYCVYIPQKECNASCFLKKIKLYQLEGCHLQGREHLSETRILYKKNLLCCMKTHLEENKGPSLLLHNSFLLPCDFFILLQLCLHFVCICPEIQDIYLFLSLNSIENVVNMGLHAKVHSRGGGGKKKKLPCTDVEAESTRKKILEPHCVGMLSSSGHN